MIKPPNVVLIHGHDLGKFLTCYDAPSIPSPQVQALADESVVFDNAFATAPLCTPARASLFTGTSPHVNGLMGLAHAGWRYRHSVRTLPELLDDAGYDTALVGLQHEHPDPNVLGFGEVHGAGFLPRALPVADEAADWLADRAGDQGPFFLTVGMWEAHRPWRREDYDFTDPAGVEVPGFLPDNEHTREDLAGFYGAIRQFDDAVGRVVAAVDRHCDPSNTMVIVTTDHGAPFPRAKGTLYDPGIEVALIVRPPGGWNVAPGRRHSLVSHLDVVPTLADLAGRAPDPAWEGRSLVETIRGADDDSRRELFVGKTFHDGYDPMRAIRTSRWKYIRNYVDGPMLALSKDLEESPTRQGMGDAHLAPRPPVELYDLAEDPHEQVNIAGQPERADLVEELDARLMAAMKSTRDPLLDGPIAPPSPPTRTVDALPDLSA